MLLFSTITRLTGVHWKDQRPAFVVGLGHGGTHWIAATFYLLLPFITRDLGLSYAQAGTLVALFHVSSTTANFGSGVAVDITGRRVLFQVASLLIGGGALLAFGITERFVVLCVLVALIGASNNLWHPPAISFLSEWYPKNRGYALSIHALGANLGDTLAPLAAGTLLAVMSWQGTAAVNALPVLSIAALIGITLLSKDSARRSRTHQHAGFGAYFAELKEIVRDKGVLSLCLMAGFRIMAQNGLLMFLPLYLANELRVSPIWMGVTLMAMQLSGLIASPIAGAWSDRVGRRPVVLSGLTVTTVVIVGLTMTRNDLVFITAVSVLGFAMFAVRPVVHSWLMDLTPAHLSGSATSLMFGMQNGLSAIVPIVGGVIADIWGLTAVFYFLAATMVVANVLVYLLPQPEPSATSVEPQ
ncbi:MAG: MFS transporter [Acidiferrobacterales bacterium]